MDMGVATAESTSDAAAGWTRISGVSATVSVYSDALMFVEAGAIVDVVWD